MVDKALTNSPAPGNNLDDFVRFRDMYEFGSHLADSILAGVQRMFDEQEKRFDRIEKRLDNHDDALERLARGQERLEDDVFSIKQALTHHGIPVKKQSIH